MAAGEPTPIPPTEAAPTPKKPRGRRTAQPPASLEGPVPGQIVDAGTREAPAESKDERRARLRRVDQDAWHRRVRETTVYVVFAAILIIITLSCSFVLFSPLAPIYPPETQKLASTLLTAIVSAGASFFAGKAYGQAKAS